MFLAWPYVRQEAGRGFGLCKWRALRFCLPGEPFHGVSRGTVLSNVKIVNHTAIWKVAVIIVTTSILQRLPFRFLPIR